MRVSRLILTGVRRSTGFWHQVDLRITLKCSALNRLKAGWKDAPGVASVGYTRLLRAFSTKLSGIVAARRCITGCGPGTAFGAMGLITTCHSFAAMNLNVWIVRKQFH